MFKSSPSRCYFALLDADGCCQGFMHCNVPPRGEGWVEVRETRLSWIQRPLPASARLDSLPAHLQ
nr:hypothetical protein [Pseudomonas spelaei]